MTTDQKVGGSSPSKRTETQEAFTTSWASSFPLVVGDVSSWQQLLGTVSMALSA
jgi:hypothetical protein